MYKRQLLNAYLTEHSLDKPGHDDHPLFTNQHRNKLSRGGIAWIIGKYQARAGDPALAGADLSPHVLRHSKAMHLYEAGVPLPYIRDILGHVDLTTTEIYARASTAVSYTHLKLVCGLVGDPFGRRFELAPHGLHRFARWVAVDV